jgi:photosystem II stability/assembly factor-like uncharacterized protein
VRSTLTSVSFPDADHGWAVGHDAAILKSSDAGRTWKLVHFDAEKQQALLDVLFVDDEHGYAVGAFGLFLVSEDGGTTWSELDAPSIRGDGMHFYGIVKLGDGELFVAGEDGMLGVSRDGHAWEKLKSPYVGSFFGAIPVGDKGAVIYGLRGNVYRTADVHSPDWKKVEIGSEQSVFGATLLDDGGIALVGADGLTIYLGADGSVDTKRFSRIQGEPGGGSLTSAIQWKQKLIAAGESGIERRSIGR